MAAIHKDREGLVRQVDLLSSQLTAVEADKKRSDNEVAKLESLVSNLQRQVVSRWVEIGEVYTGGVHVSGEEEEEAHT